MDNEKFKKLLFLAKLAGDKAIGELMIDLLHMGEKEHAYSIHKTYCPGAIAPPAEESLSKDHPCEWSPYGYCYTNELGLNTEQFDPHTHVCIWCEKLWAPPNTVEPKIELDYWYNLRSGELHRE